MAQRLFQDPAGTIPAILAGQPVGLVKRMAGTVDAVQATALSKPTLARWPMSGVRNMAMGADAFDLSAYWFSTQGAFGISVSRIGTGLEDGVPYADYDVSGTATALVSAPFYQSSRGLIPKGQVPVVLSATARVLSGSFPAGAGLRVNATAGDASGQSMTGTQSSPVVFSNSDTVMSTVVSSDLNPASVNIRAGVGILVLAEQTVSAVVRVKLLQFEVGNTPTAHQFNYGPNDITEPGVKDLWHLYNDGGDSLNVTLPAGTYGTAFLDIDRNVTIGTATSDGSTPINTVPNGRQIDAILRAGAFSPAEEIALREFWAKEYPL